jgi:hypothetical protein
MKIGFLLVMSTVALVSLVLVGCKTAKTRTATSKELPASCTLLAMSPEERVAHQQRLESLNKAASLRKVTADGFVFAVDLRRMPKEDPQLWMENEQKCCSFLRMTHQVIEKDVLAEVAVVCPAEMRAAVMQTFGLRSINE